MLNIFIWTISLLAIFGVIIRPFKIPEVFWAVSGAALLVVFRLISISQGWMGIVKGLDVYLFLTGMMLLAETARVEGVFDWLAAQAVKHSKGSAGKLFILIYIVGILVTAFLSNDATAVVLTPAVAAATRVAKVKNPLPYLLICAFIANAASFLLPISNPANLVIYGNHLPELSNWIPTYILPALASIIVTYFVLRFSQRMLLKEKIETDIPILTLSIGGKLAMTGILATSVILMVCSMNDVQMGMATAITGTITSLVVLLAAKRNPIGIIRSISWSVIPLVAALFIIVEGLGKTGVLQHITALLSQCAEGSESKTAWASGLIVAFSSNVLNNLPAGLIAGHAVQASQVSGLIKSAILIGIDLGPNLSITGSLATILWLVALKREGLSVSAWTFLKLGFVVMITALLAALLCLYI